MKIFETVEPVIGDNVQISITGTVTAFDGYGNAQVVDDNGVDHIVAVSDCVVLERLVY